VGGCRKNFQVSTAALIPMIENVVNRTRAKPAGATVHAMASRPIAQ
jgi:hypothetical protein